MIRSRHRASGRPLSGLVLAAAAVLAAAGCGGPGARQDAAAAAGAAFEAAVAAGDHVRACGLLAPQTRKQLEQDEHKACPAALASQELPRTHGVQGVEAYGRQAMVRMAGDDTLFLSLFTGGWKVVAAGCTPRPDRPYDCLLKGA
ncbi:hypothetical protein EDD96_5779 [Streptomyces sp. Ag109_G2-6]|uniref:hypothetical protein n=1 Tax=Streptomyces TaxID=1883 RepID=UPI000FBBCDA8|nr:MULTISPECIES: hypothetical protein [Streptomyces]RPF29262.1 hypothetical protein EDD96_5779 [Streptomyces sp. Ag109_G2-6]